MSEQTYDYDGDFDSTDDPGPSQSGGAFINAGTYGCAFSPPLKCKDPKKNPPATKKSIGKVFSKKDSFETEIKEMKKIKTFDPTFQFTVPYLNDCMVNRSDFKPTDETVKCNRHITSSQSVYPQIMYQYGGIDLANIYEKPDKYPFELDTLFALCLPVFKGIQKMGVAKYTHVDIKPPNMLLDITSTPPKVYLIDFGLLTKFDDLKYQFYLHTHRYPYYPPEFKIYDSHRKGIFETRTILQLCMDNFNYFNQMEFFRWMSKRWPGYMVELQSAIQAMHTLSFADFMKDFDNEIVHKVDSYGIAITLVELAYRFETFIPTKLKLKNRAFYEDCLQTVLFPMIHPNVYTRIPIDEAIVRLEDLLKKYFGTPSPPPPPKKKKPVPPPHPPSNRTPSPASPTRPSPLSMEQCMTFKLSELHEYLEKHQLPKYGKKEVLCQRLMKAMNDNHEEHKSAKRILKEIAHKDKKLKRPPPGSIPPPQNDIQREIDRLYIKPFLQCNQPENKGGYSITELREIARQLRLKHAKKRDEICKELSELRRRPNP
jgi:serine/threonine protein kinase